VKRPVQEDAGGGAAARAYCRAVLPRVSRTFALNIRILPRALRDVVLEAYLFCRIADTVEDSPCLTPEAKRRRLDEYAGLFPLRCDWEPRVREWARGFQGLAAGDGDRDREPRGADLELCRNAVEVFRAFRDQPAALRAPVEECVREMALGMRDFAGRRTASPAGRLQLEDLADLERYCHVVAGTVGQMLVRLIAATSSWVDAVRAERLRSLAGRFGLAMQLTNILKDMAEDARRGVCYVPRALAARHRLDPEALFDPRHRREAGEVVQELAARAVGALDAALAFTLLIPRREARLRLFCLWPLFLAARTLRRLLHDERIFVAGARPRVGRHEVRRCLGETSLAVFSNSAIRWLYGRRRPVLAGPLAC
jgi:farnesyl-diphosphate farnesyltransferase